MQKSYLAASVLLVLLTATACGAEQPAAAPGNQTTNKTVSSSNVTANEIANATSNPNTTEKSSTISLTPFEQSKSSGIHVSIPTGWNETPIHGGDYMGWKLTNPKDPSQQVKIITSGCVGCTETSSGSVDAKKVIPENNAEVTTTSDNHYIADYTFPTENKNNLGNGVISVSHDSSGYGSVEVVLPETEQTTAKQIIDSFQLTR